MFTNATFECENQAASGTQGAAASPPPVPAQPANEPSSGGGGTPGWLWPVVGSVLGVLAVAAVGAALLLMRRRRKRLDSDIKLEAAVPPDAAGLAGTACPIDSKPSTDLSTPNPSLTSLPPASSLLLGSFRVGPIEGLEMGDLLGRGGFGACYKGAGGGAAWGAWARTVCGWVSGWVGWGRAGGRGCI